MKKGQPGAASAATSTPAETRKTFRAMPLTDPSEWDEKWRIALDLLWPRWPRYKAVPPLDDIDLRDFVRDGELPAWCIDRLQTIRAFGGNAWAPGEVHGRLVAKPRFSNGLGEGVRRADIASNETVAEREIAQPYYSGTHRSTDWAVWNGRVVWGIESEGVPVPGRLARFAMWCTPPEPAPRPGPKFYQAVFEAIPAFTGVVNVETIGPDVVEVHFRPSIELFRCYGPDAVDALMATARGERVDAPDVTGGAVIVTPRDSLRVQPREWGEFSWRRDLHYLT